MTSRLVIIPARGGSKRIPDKNIRNFCGQPMIAYALQTAAASGLFETIHVSTESARIADVVGKLGHPVEFCRPEHLADDHTPLMPVLRYVTETFISRGKRFDQIWLLMACTPLIEPDDLLEASNLFSSHAARRPVMAVAQYPAPVEWAYRRAADNGLIPLRPDMHAVRSQDIDQAYFDAGSFCIYPAERVLESEGAGDYSAYVGYLLPRWKAIDIDDEEDFKLAEAIYLANRQKTRSLNR